MKHIFFLFSLIFLQIITYSQPKIDKITWVGENNEYLNIGKKKASLQKEKELYLFEVAKYVKNSYFILAKTYGSVKYEQKYDIVHLTKDTLILSPEGDDVFQLAETNKQNQYVFVNSMLTYQFEQLYFEVSFNNFDNPKNDRLKFILYIDSDKNSRVVIQNETFEETTMYTAPPSKIEYESLIKILSSFDLSCFPEEDIEMDKESRYSILEFKYNNETKTFRGFNSLPDYFAEKLSDFVYDYIELRANINAKWGWRVFILKGK